MATTIDHISNGRLELGVGAGWWEMEHDEYGIPMPSIGRRIRMLGETLPILKSLWTEHRTTFEGRYYQLNNALCEPKPVQTPHIPLWVGGGGEKLTLRAVAQYADGWNTFFMPLDQYRHKLEVLAAHCAAVGRDPAEIRKSLVVQAVVARTDGEIASRVEQLASARRTTPEALRGQALIGTPAQCAEQLVPYVEAGVGDFIIGARAPFDYGTFALVAAEVAPAVKERFAHVAGR